MLSVKPLSGFQGISQNGICIPKMGYWNRYKRFKRAFSVLFCFGTELTINKSVLVSYISTTWLVYMLRSGVVTWAFFLS